MLVVKNRTNLMFLSFYAFSGLVSKHLSV